MLKVATAVTAALAGLIISSGVSPARTQSVSEPGLSKKLEKLSPQPAISLPSSLADLVSMAQAAVIAKIGSPGDMVFVEETFPETMKVVTDAVARYDVFVEEVLFNRKQQAAPPLSAGTAVLSQVVYREDATDFAAGKPPVRSNDRCLLFLWHRPDLSEWSIMNWSLQFRALRTNGSVAEPVRPLPNGRTLLRQEWIGATVPLTKSSEQSLPQWEALVAEVKRLATVR